jgi:catechol 2,3-dioxygenase-like lactoylglutathione lyase family enzyme
VTAGGAPRAIAVDHLTLAVGDLARSRAFYEAALAPLGHHVELFDGEPAFGPAGSEDFLIRAGGPTTPPLHLAFGAPSRAAVEAFHAAALAAGATDNGAPGPRPQYHAGYYAAFVLDPDGHNVEAVFHDLTLRAAAAS